LFKTKPHSNAGHAVAISDGRPSRALVNERTNGLFQEQSIKNMSITVVKLCLHVSGAAIAIAAVSMDPPLH